MDLTEFLLARIAEDEEVARAATGRHWHAQESAALYTLPGDDPPWSRLATGDSRPTFAHIARHDPARVLAECESKRATVVTYRSFVQASESATDLGPKLTAAGAVAALEVVLKYLALPYADHPDYDPAWRP